jgi:diketogulonate reductase-like aldo/keto reductase
MSTAVKHRRLGRTGFTIPEIGLGTWKYRGGVAPLRAGIERGAHFIDTAEYYGTEGTVGEAVQKIRDRVFIASKVSPRHFRRRDLLKAADESLLRLRTDRIDLYQLHWPNYTVPMEETMGAMEELAEAGKVRFIGVSNFSVGELRRAQAALSKHRIVSNQVRFSLVDRTIEPRLLRYCQQNDITVIAFTPLAHGLQNLRARDPGSALADVAARNGRTEAQVALNWCLSRDGVVAIPKASTVARVEENCGASGWSLSPDDVALLDRSIRYRRRGVAEAALRRLARRIVQHFGRSL